MCVCWCVCVLVCIDGHFMYNSTPYPFLPPRLRPQVLQLPGAPLPVALACFSPWLLL